MRRHRFAIPPLVALCAGLPLAGCSLPADEADFASDLPSDRALATALASRREEPADIPALIAQLDSSDPAIRLLAQRSLERRTGQDLGYHFADDEARRSAAVARWAAWYAEGEGSR